MPKRFKFHALMVFLLAVLLYLFFQISKHQPALAQVNAFAEDPYDAVGSFGVQFALFTALLSLVRAFRPYQSDKAPEAQEVLFARGAFITYASVAVVLATDVIAMIRYPTMWIGLSAGYTLAALLGGMTLFTAITAWFVRSPVSMTRASFPRSAWITAGGIALASILVLAFYPESWRKSIHGALFTAFVGTILFFAAVWAWERVTMPRLETFFEDCIDDLASTYHWFKARMGYLKPFFTAFERTRNWPVIQWLNPRKHVWNGIIVAGILLGIGLALAEVSGEGGADPHQVGRLLTVIAVFVGLESIGVLLGYAFLARPLGLFRRTSGPGLDASSIEQ